MIIYIKVNKKHFKEFESLPNGGRRGGHSGSFHCNEVKKAIFTDEVIERDPISAKGIITELLDLMRYGNLKKSKIEIEVI